MRHLASPQDIALGISVTGSCRNVLLALELAHSMDLLTLAMTGHDGGVIASSESIDFAFVARSYDPLIVKEIQVTTGSCVLVNTGSPCYNIAWVIRSLDWQ